jgi:hypothetical protein
LRTLKPGVFFASALHEAAARQAWEQGKGDTDQAVMRGGLMVLVLEKATIKG